MNFFKKTFDIELGDPLIYPSSERIREVISIYCSNSKQNFDFINENSPVTFKLDDVLYKATVNMARGGYIIICTEV